MNSQDVRSSNRISDADCSPSIRLTSQSGGEVSKKTQEKSRRKKREREVDRHLQLHRVDLPRSDLDEEASPASGQRELRLSDTTSTTTTTTTQRKRKDDLHTSSEIEDSHQNNEETTASDQDENITENTFVEFPGQGSFPWENPVWFPGCGSAEKRLVQASLWDKCRTPEIEEYVTEIQWLKEQTAFVQAHLNGTTIEIQTKGSRLTSAVPSPPRKDAASSSWAGEQDTTEKLRALDALESLSPLIPTAAFLYRSTYRQKRVRRRIQTSDDLEDLGAEAAKHHPSAPKRLLPNAIVLVPTDPLTFQSAGGVQHPGSRHENPTAKGTALPPSISCSTSFYAAFPESFRQLVQQRWLDPTSKVLLGASRRLRRRYGEIPSHLPLNPHLLIDSYHDRDAPHSSSGMDADHQSHHRSPSGAVDDETLTSSPTSRCLSFSSQQQQQQQKQEHPSSLTHSGDEAHRSIPTVHRRRSTPSVLLLNPMLPHQLSHLMQYHLQPTSQHGGTASPVSPVLPNAEGTVAPGGGGGGSMVGVPMVVGGVQPPPMNGVQPTMPKRNRSHLCVLRHTETLTATGMTVHGKRVASQQQEQGLSSNPQPPMVTDGWSWDKSEPLSLPGLCSCIDPPFYRLWQNELALHRSQCFLDANTRMATGHLKQQTAHREMGGDNSDMWDWRSPGAGGQDPTSSSYNLALIEWDQVKQRNFESFLADLKVELQRDGESEQEMAFSRLRFCGTCGGLTYIAFSFIEISLTRDIPTLPDLVKKLPLPVPTDMFCDGLRITVTLAARSPLHEWIILCSLQFAGLEKTCRVYNVCPSLIYPFYRLPERWPNSGLPQELLDEKLPQEALLPSRPCSRHQLLHKVPPSKWLLMDSPSRFAHTQHRRPYCLTLRKTLQFPVHSDAGADRIGAQSSAITFAAFEDLCWHWLYQQTAGTDVSIPATLPVPLLQQQLESKRLASPPPPKGIRSSGSSTSSASGTSSGYHPGQRTSQLSFSSAGAITLQSSSPRSSSTDVAVTNQRSTSASSRATTGTSKVDQEQRMAM